MIEEIRISELGVIESSTLDLGPGLTVITGETGAGKTMVVTALGLLLGGRADSGAVRSGARTARVEGIVVAGALPEGAQADFVDAVDAVGGEVDEDRVVLARTVAAEGRSRAFVGGASVPVARLAEAAEPLVAVHGQSDQHRLLRPSAQRDALDRFAASTVAQPLEQWRAAYAELATVERELVEVVESARERAREADQLRFALEEIEAVSPEPDEADRLSAEETRLGFADTLRAAAEQAREALSSDAPTESTADALGAVSTARKALDGVRDHDSEAAALADRLAEVSYLLSDVAADVASYASGIDTDPARLAAVSERRAALLSLTRKYGETLGEVLAWAESSALRLLALDGTDERIDELRQRRVALRETLSGVGENLSAVRGEAGQRLGAVVTDELGQLAMPHARVSLSVTQTEKAPPDRDGPGAPIRVGERWLATGPHGFDEIEFLLAANTGSEPRALHRGASGGELSRVMLALEVALAGTSPVPTFVFDEVDAGVGGKAAVEVGRRLAALARSAQVLVVTHLPQVAAFADRHVVVAKSSDGTVTTSGLTVLDEDSRVRELSRMLAGMEESDTALAHAQELLETARSTR